MANDFGYLIPEFYANQALISLKNSMGMSGRVHRGYDRERRSFAKGKLINISAPPTYEAKNAPSTAQDTTIGQLQLELAYWREVKHTMTDEDLTLTGDEFMEKIIGPMTDALADDIDVKLTALYKDIPWFYALSGTPVVADVIGPRTQMFNNKVPVKDTANMHYMMDGTLEGGLMGLTAFSQYQGAGQTAVNTQMNGNIGLKYNMNTFANQNVQTHTKGTSDTGTLLLKEAHSKGDTTVDLDAASVAGTLVAGDTFVLAGNTQRYAVTATSTAASNEFIGVAITPALVADYVNNAACTMRLETKVCNLAFHRNAFALAMAPLTEMANELGQKVFGVTDPETGLAIRARLFSEGNASTISLALDVLYGVKTLDPNLACRGENAVV